MYKNSHWTPVLGIPHLHKGIGRAARFWKQSLNWDLYTRPDGKIFQLTEVRSQYILIVMDLQGKFHRQICNLVDFLHL